MLLNSSDLGSHLKKLRNKFLPEARVKELAKPENFEQDLDARAYLVLAHSAFEQFFEDTAREFASSAVERWNRGLSPTKQQIITICCLATSQGDFLKQLNSRHIELINKERELVETKAVLPVNPRIKLADSLRNGLKNFESLLEKNHGADIHYLNVIFTPIGIFVDPTPDAHTALNQIANSRGTFAHRRTAAKKGKFAYKPIAAEKALLNVEMLFSWCKDLEINLRSYLRPDYQNILKEAKFELICNLTKAIQKFASLKQEIDNAEDLKILLVAAKMTRTNK